MSEDNLDPEQSGETERVSGIHEALGQSDAFLDFQERLSRVAQVDRPVLIVGERGTGKELAASRVHYLSRRWDGPFVALNCSALSATLIEAELFGHEAGAFTGATGRRRGRFEAADGGTLFLDELGSIPLQVQEKIMRAVEYGTFERVGSSKPIEVNARIVGATNSDLRAMAASGEFMPDLLDRLSFEVLVLPPLRERREDISLLANHFAARMAFELEWAEMPEITEEAMELLLEFAWPGNVRELKNVIERAVYRSADMVIDANEIIFDPFEAFSTQLPKPGAPGEEFVHEEGAPPQAAEESADGDGRPEPDLSKPFQESIREVELGLLKKALEEAKFNQRKAAELLDLTYHQFRGLYRKYQDDIGD